MLQMAKIKNKMNYMSICTDKMKILRIPLSKSTKTVNIKILKLMLDSKKAEKSSSNS